VDNGLRDADPLLIALRQVADQASTDLGQSALLFDAIQRAFSP
jgi:hypothetical protein